MRPLCVILIHRDSGSEVGHQAVRLEIVLQGQRRVRTWL